MVLYTYNINGTQKYFNTHKKALISYYFLLYRNFVLHLNKRHLCHVPSIR